MSHGAVKMTFLLPNFEKFMKLFYDILPIIAFFIAFKVYDIYVATAVAITFVFLQVITTYLRGKKPEIMHIVTLIMITLLGGATLIFRDELFIKWKPTAVYWILSVLFLASQYLGTKTIAERLLGKSVSLPVKQWHRLNFSWFAFFLIMGCLNLFVAYHYDTDTWVNFKLFGTLALTLIFVLGQAVFLAKHLPSEQTRQK